MYIAAVHDMNFMGALYSVLKLGKLTKIIIFRGV